MNEMRRFKRVALTLTVAALFIFAARSMYAAETVVELSGRSWKAARAEVVFRDADEKKKEVIIKAAGLKAHSVFSVWLLNTKHKESAGLGYGNFDFTSNGRGEGYYRTFLPIEELDKWEAMAVYLHPDGDARNLKDRKEALRGKLKKKVKRGMVRVW
jgi:hypothetical protein